MQKLVIQLFGLNRDTFLWKCYSGVLVHYVDLLEPESDGGQIQEIKLPGEYAGAVENFELARYQTLVSQFANCLLPQLW
jgi:hypothetical protein